MKRFLALLLSLTVCFAPVTWSMWTPLDDPAEATAGAWILPSAARTATTFSGVISLDPGAVCVMFLVNTTAGAGYSITPILQIEDPQTASWRNATGSAAITTNTVSTYIVCQGNSGNANVSGGNMTGSFGFKPPPRFRIAISHTDATSVTYSVTGVAW